MPEDLADSYSHCGALLHEEDRDAWLAALFVPTPLRPHIHAIDAFFAEIRRVRDRVRQPLAGELRLQWWRDAIEGEARGGTQANPVAAALLDTVSRFHLSRGTLIDALDAHGGALYGAPPAGVADLEGFFDRTIGASLRSQVKVLLGPASLDGEATRHAAVALGTVDILRYLAHYVNRGFAVIPDEVLARHGMEQGSLRGLAPDAAPFRAVLAELRALARTHLALWRAETFRIPGPAAPAFLTLSLVEPMLRVSERASDPLAAELSVPQWRRQWMLWRAARRSAAG